MVIVRDAGDPGESGHDQVNDEVLRIAHLILVNLDSLGPEVVGEVVELPLLVYFVDAEDEVQVELDGQFRVA